TLVVVLEEEALEPRAPEHSLADGLVAAARVEHRLIVAAADMETEADAGMVADDGVVHLDAGIDEPFGIAPALTVPFPDRRVEERRVLGRVDLDVGAAQPGQLFDLAPGEVRRTEASTLDATARLDEVRRAQQASHHVATIDWHFRERLAFRRASDGPSRPSGHSLGDQAVEPVGVLADDLVRDGGRQ